MPSARDFNHVRLHFFGDFTEEEIQKRYQNQEVVPCSLDKWQSNEESYKVAVKAISPDRRERYASWSEFWDAWKQAVSIKAAG